MKTLPLSILLLSSFLTGCYTQLATRGHYARAQAAPAYGLEAAPADSTGLASAGVAGSLAEDSTWAAVPADTLVPPVGAPTVIVHNYYDSQPHHRGYAHWEWEYPLISFGYYSSHYGRYSRPYWWDDPWYSRRHIHHRHSLHNHDYVPVRPGPSGPYKSEKRLFNPDPAYQPVRKGRRAAAPVSAPAAEAAPAPAPAPKEGSSGSGSSASSSGSEGSGSSESKSQKQEDKPEKEHRTLQKGRRR